MLRRIASSQLTALEDVLTAWFVESAYPVWANHGRDALRGGFYEALSHGNYENTANYKRLRVLARQVYVFSEATRFGLPESRSLVIDGIGTILRCAKHPEGGFCSRLSLECSVVDSGRDLYDLAFVLFALAHAYNVTGEPHLEEEAESLFAFLQKQLAHPAGGFYEGLPAKMPRRQNPHMHLLEACLVWARYGRNVWQQRAGDLVELALSRFLHADSGSLTEYFTDDLNPLPEMEGELVEPGHQFEWVWLLAQYEKLENISIPEIDRLYSFAWTHGMDRSSGLLHGEVTVGGTVRPGATRLWAYTEWLKAELAMFERSRQPGYVARAVFAGISLAEFLNTPTPGLWFERRHSYSGFASEPAPATSLYHITLALSELRRVKAIVDIR